ncbi:MAG: hypothetical protein L3J29_00200 [Cyclobacteriaceae bacterium]|nr:hypothetical protein [Cyclobacteriaceae bacterium]
MKKQLSIALICLSGISAFAQSIDKADDINGITLGIDQTYFGDDLYLITGDEPAYSEAPSLQFTLKRKIRLGIRDASYQGQKYREFENFEATNITFQFYEGKLFKVQWTFRNRQALIATYNYLLDTYADKFGSSKEEVFDEFRQVEWEGKSKYLQVFMDTESDVTLVFEDVKVAKRVQKVLAKAK